jgi:hypothetical protein
MDYILGHKTGTLHGTMHGSGSIFMIEEELLES